MDASWFEGCGKLDALQRENTGPTIVDRLDPNTDQRRAPLDLMINNIMKLLGNPSLAVTTWTGDRFGPSDAEFHVEIRSRASLLKISLDPDRYFGDEYSAGRILIDGDLVRFLEHIMSVREEGGEERFWRRQIRRIRRARKNSIAGSAANIHHHYDIGNAFYERWLDKQMQYTCALFENPNQSLEEAQIAKMDLVCRKLRLKPGDEVIEAGCGWGGLARYMARQYGVRVRAYNISAEQIAYARKRARAEGLADRVEYIAKDYREITGECDAFVSVGMLEHVGVKHYTELGQVVNRCLSNRGIGLIHTIGQNLGRPMNSWIERHIFPGAYPPTLGEIMGILQPHNFSVLDVENLRLHYARTLKEWLERYEDQIEMTADEQDSFFARAWRFYLAGSQATFLTGRLQLFQVVFSRHMNNAIPLTRDHLVTR